MPPLPWPARPLRAAALFLLAVTALLPGLWRGGLSPASQALACGLCGLALACAAGLTLRSRAEGLPLWFALPPALVALAAAAQCIPLPARLCAILARASWELRSFPPAPVPLWAPLTLDLPATLSALALPVAAACAAGAAGLLGREPRMRRQLLALPVVAASIQAVLCLWRFADGQGAAGSFVNRNHEAALLVFGALVALGAALDPPRGRSAPELARHSRELLPQPLRGDLPARLPWAIACALCAATALLTLSRGGAGSLVAGAVALALLQRRAQGKARPESRRQALITGAAIAAAALGLVLVFSLDAWVDRSHQLSPASLRAEIKLRSFGAAVQVVREHAGTGVGRGAWRFVADLHRSVPGDDEYVFVENEPLQLAAELGVPLALAVISLLAFAWVKAARGARDGLSRGAVAAALALALHNLVDFNLSMPGVLLPVCIALGAALGGAARMPDSPRREKAKVRSTRLRALILLAPLAAGLAAAAILIEAPRSADADEARLRATSADRKVSAAALVAQARLLVARHPADWLLSLLPAIGLSEREEFPRDALAWAGRAQLLAPRNWRTHAVVAALLLRAGARAQARIETRLGLEGHDANVAWPLLGLAARASTSVDELIDSVPPDAVARSRLVERVREDHRSADARALAQRSLALAAPDDPPAALETLREQLANLSLEAGDLPAAAAAAATLDARSCVRALLEGRIATAQKLPAPEVDAPYLRGLSACPSDRALTEALVRGRLARGDAAGALEALVALPAEDPDSGWAADAHLLHAEALEADGKKTRGLAERWLAATLAPARPDLALDYAARLSAEGDPRAALEALRELEDRARGDARDRIRARLAELEAATPPR